MARMDGDILKKVNACTSCQANQNNPRKSPIHPWEWTSKPWVRLHIDHAGPYLNKMFLIVIDSYSKWMEVVPTTADSADTIRKLRKMFATHGIPEQIVSDNGSAFTSETFERFLQQNGIKQIRTSPYHPSSNGMAERMVQTFKNTMNKIAPGNDFEKMLQKFLFTYRITPQATTGKTPAELLMNRKLVSALDLIRPNLERKIRSKQSSFADDPTRRIRSELHLKAPVFIRNFGQGSKWWRGTIVNRSGPVTWLIEVDDGRIIQRHTDHIRLRQDSGDIADTTISSESTQEIPVPSSIDTQLHENLPIEESAGTNEPVNPETNRSEANANIELPLPSVNVKAENLLPRRSERIRKPPEFYGDVVTHNIAVT